MLGTSPNQQQLSLFGNSLVQLIDPKQSLSILSLAIDWQRLEKIFKPLYATVGQPSHPIRKMVSLLLLQRIYKLSDERVVEEWRTNIYFQYFSGEALFQWSQPCAASDLVHFRNRIGENGIKILFQLSVDLHASTVKKTKEVLVDTTVQEKNITYPTDAKQYQKVIARCKKVAQQAGIKLRQSYVRIVHLLVKSVRYSHLPKKAKAAKAAVKKLKTLAGRQVRDLSRKLTIVNKTDTYKVLLGHMTRIVTQQRTDKDKLYSLHAPEVSCITKGKVHKKYEFGSKVSVASLPGSNVVVGVKTFLGNPHDSTTLSLALSQAEDISKKSFSRVIVDRGYRGHKKIGSTEVILPDAKCLKTEYEKRRHRQHCRKRSAIEAVISHMKHDHGMGRNYLKGTTGDTMNALLSAMGFNISILMRKYRLSLA